MIDYTSVWIKFVAFFEIDEALRQKVINNLHDEVKKGFDVLTKVSMEELEHILPKELYKAINNELEQILALSVFQGYVLFLISNNIDPEKNKLSVVKSTQEVGRAWMQEYEKDKAKSLIEEIDPVISMYLEKSKQARMNQLLSVHSEINDRSYKEISSIDKFINWILHQGYLLGYLERILNIKNG